MTENELSIEILSLSLRCQQGVASEEDRARLEYLLRESEEARLVYSGVALDTVTLAEVANKNSLVLPNENPTDDEIGTLAPAGMETELRPVRKGSWQFLLALAALVLIASWSVAMFQTKETVTVADRQARPLARIVHLEDVQWNSGAVEFAEWSAVNSGDSLQIESGMLELVVDDVIQVVIQGPANFELVSAEKALAHSGKLVARIGEEGIGFEIETPHAHVVDQGTAFSISVSPEAQTDVVVYEGIVDLSARDDSLPDSSQPPIFRRLQSGEGMRVDSQGELNRITSVGPRDFLPPLRLGREAVRPSRLIASVTDNVSSLETSKYYRIVGEGFAEDCVSYVDRLHQWNGIDGRGIPGFLHGADYVMTFNDDKVLDDLQIAIEVTQPVAMYVLWDDRIEVPEWLSKDFLDTGWDIGLDEGYNDRVPDVSRKTELGAGKSVDFVFSIWKQEVRHASTVLLGSVQQARIDEAPREVSQSMYSIVVAPLRGFRGNKAN
ncbi:FecR protein [Bythopirellula polymerisocia]|uniref:FecR protein n=2 Tax=Bythopirellula polymerisocia TaxID=2528003 RepID=A0A5C6D2W2_9BACT|nr:FecR protein [Bythopirellula polymerisocia]